VSYRRLVLRSLVHYWRTGAVVAIGLAVATAVIVGSLVIGDSIKGSVRRTALARLGVIFDAITAPRFFRAALAEEANIWGRVEALIRVDGSARAEGSDAVIANVSVVGIDDGFWGLYPHSETRSIHQRSAIINESLASDARVSAGDVLLVTIARPSEAMADTLFARREREDTLATLRLTVQAVLPDLGPGGFRLDPSAAAPRNVIVDREWLAEQIGEPGGANTLVVGPVPGPDGTYPDLADLRRTDVFGPSPPPSQQHEQIKQAMTLDDHGLYLRAHGNWVSVFTDAITLTEAQIEAVQQAAWQFGSQAHPTSVYLADAIEVVGAPSRLLVYAVVANTRGKQMRLVEGSSPGHEGVWLNEWAASDLGVTVGDRLDLRLRWRVSTPSGYEDRSVELPLGGVVAMEGLGADPGLVPDFEGITDAEHIDEWDPPFPIDLSRVTERDEEYWDQHRAAPKAFVGSDLLRRMWQGQGGEGPWVTSVRVGVPQGRQPEEFKLALGEHLLGMLGPRDAGVRVRNVREQALEASQGTSDFGQLFLAMSIFLVFAGAGLAGTLMRLSAERRASQAGIMLATGLQARDASRTIVVEGVALSLIGAALGTPLGVLYAHGVIRALATYWQGALGDAPVLGVFVLPLTVIEGALAALLVGVIATWWGARVLGRRPVLELLRGWRTSAADPIGGLPWTAIATPLLLLAAAGLFVAAITEAIPAQGAFFGIGGALLLAALGAAHLLLRRAVACRGAADSLHGLALRNAASARGRSLLPVGLIAAATFVLVTVAANSRDFSAIDVRDRSSGTGGFSLLATSSVPLRFDPATEEGRENLGFLPDEQEALRGTEIISLPQSPGQDISCLNIARPTHPRLLGVTDEMIERGGFPVTATPEAPGNPWRLLSEDRTVEAVPAFGDAASLTWQLHTGVGETFELAEDMPDLRIVGALHGSIFQSELLVHEDALRRIYPQVEGPSYFLVDAPEGRQEAVAQALRAALGDMGVEVRTTREVLNRYITVQNTYLTMFLALGGMGLLLGTIGLVAVILRSAFERRSEFALMLATGFTRANLRRLLIVENAGLLAAGMVAGMATALVAVAPHLSSTQANANWGALAAVLGAILAVGLIACIAGAGAAVRGRLIEALRTE